MKKILSPLLFLMIMKSVSWSQNTDTLIFETCNNLYEEEMFQEAFDCYVSHDTNIYAIYMAAHISVFLEDSRNFDRYTKKLISRKYRSAESYHLCANLYEEEAEKLKVIEKGLKKYKNDTTLLVDLTNLYLESNNYEMARESVKRLLEHTKVSHESHYFTLGYLNDLLGQGDTAIACYEKAIAINPSYFDAYFNAGVVYFNQAVDMYKVADNIMDMQAYKEKINESNTLFRKALPYFEKANAIRPGDPKVEKTLETLRRRLKLTRE